MKTNLILFIGFLILFFTSENLFAQPTRMRAYENAHMMSGNGNNQMVTICHQTGNGSITITVNQNALDAHLAHGDVIGTCANNDNDDHDDSDNDNDESDDDNDESDNDNDDNDESDDDNDDTTTDTTTVPDTNPAPACAAAEVISYIPGTTNDLLTPIDPARQILSNVLGTPEDSDVATSAANYNFVALGFGGEITLKFAYPIHNGDGNDIYVVETTFGPSCARYPEKVRAFASQDGCNWIWLGDGCQNTLFDLKTLGWAQYIKLQDISDIAYPFGGIADGFDVDGILCLNGEEMNPVPAAFSNAYATSVVSFTQGTMKNGNPVPAVRSNSANALGAPQGTDVVNFVSLGFGGSIVLGFDYLVYDKAGVDFTIVETSYGNPTCTNYPETARLEVSLDNTTWYAVSGEVCLDQPVDVASAGLPYFSFLRITDASRISSLRFPGSADGFDVDGIVISQPGCGAPAPRYADNTTTPDEVAEITLAQNPFSSELAINLSASSVNEVFEVVVTNAMGQIVLRSQAGVSANSTIRHSIGTSELAQGAYLVNVRSAFNSQTIRAIKF
jgi:hypothetical protein